MTNTPRWRGYSSDEIASLSNWHIIGSELKEHRCPNCGLISLRIYMYRSRYSGSLSKQIWCRKCRSYAGWTGPYPEAWNITDPLGDLTADEFSEIASNEEWLFSHLDSLWQAGLLPQSVTPK